VGYMKRFEYGRIEKLAQSLDCAGIDKEVGEQILRDAETILAGTTPEKKAAWMRGAMQRMDELLAPDVRQSVREDCACCLGGKREKLVKEIAKKGGSLDERIKAANETPFAFGHNVALQPDGRILVRFAPEGLEKYGCPCLPKAEQPLPITYCYCCGGHVKHHLQIATGRKLEMTVISSALSSGWEKPCSFLFALAGENA
jgi:hypothetical protein